MTLSTSQTCGFCARSYPPERSDQVYCTKSCRQKAKRARRAAKAESQTTVPATTTSKFTREERIADAEQWLKERWVAVDEAAQRDDLTDEERERFVGVLLDQVSTALGYLDACIAGKYDDR